MTNSEFSNEFDVLYNNIMSNAAPGLNEYEKSVFLTKAQDEIVKAYFNPRTNKTQEGFDGNQKRQYDFSSLLRTEKLINVSSHIDNTETLDSRSIPFIFPKNYFLSVNEVVTDNAGNKYSVLPISYEEYDRLMLKPYQYPIKRQVWRMLTDKKNVNIGTIDIKTTNGVTAPVTIYSTYASDKRILKFNLIWGNNPYIPSTDKVSLHRVKNDYNLEEINCYLPDLGYKLWDNDKQEDNLLYELRNLKEGTPEVGQVNLSHWDYFKYFDFPNRIEAIDLGEFEVNDVIFSIETKVENRPIAELIGKFQDDISTYYMRYVKTPLPIILENWKKEDGVSIKGLYTKTECELPEEVHHEILQRAVELAKAAYTGDLNSQVALGVNSQTNLGMVAAK